MNDNYTIEEFTHNGLTVKIVNDFEPESPRDWDNLGTMVCWNNRYTLGDKHTFSCPEAFDAFQKDTPCVVLPIYLYDHSGITINTTGFSCPWDSGQVGYIYVTLEAVRKEYNVQRVSKVLRKRVEEYLTGEVNTYDEYLRGEVYGFVIEDETGEPLDSCWGFYGIDYVREEALSMAEYLSKSTNAA